MEIYTIGFTKKTARSFFELIKNNDIDTLIDIRLNNTSQLAGFAKSPDIEYFLKEICNVNYFHDRTFAPTDKLLKDYKNNRVTWEFYEQSFEEIMNSRKIKDYIINQYDFLKDKNICLLCSEDTAEKCHRRLVAQYFASLFNTSVNHL